MSHDIYFGDCYAFFDPSISVYNFLRFSRLDRRAASLLVRWLLFRKDDHDLAGFDELELFARNLLDGGRIGAECLNFHHEPLILHFDIAYLRFNSLEMFGAGANVEPPFVLEDRQKQDAEREKATDEKPDSPSDVLLQASGVHRRQSPPAIQERPLIISKPVAVMKYDVVIFSGALVYGAIAALIAPGANAIHCH